MNACPVNAEAINPEEITLVFQGPWTEQTNLNIQAAKKIMPEATVILSTFASNRGAASRSDADIKIFCDDPGALPAYKRTRNAPPNNINRQIVTTYQGLCAVKTRYAAKIRTDCVLHEPRAFLSLFTSRAADAQGKKRMVVNSFYTLHPDGIERFPFHVSDWFFFSTTRQLLEYWDVPLMTMEDATWFDHAKHAENSNYFARLYRSRFAPEQYLTVAYAKKRNYRTPNFINDCAHTVVDDYREFLVREFIVAGPDQLGFHFPKYGHVTHSNYQYFNCVSYTDWNEMHETYDAVHSSALRGAGRPLSRTAKKRQSVCRMMTQLDPILPVIKITGTMPLLGKVLSLYK